MTKSNLMIALAAITLAQLVLLGVLWASSLTTTPAEGDVGGFAMSEYLDITEEIGGPIETVTRFVITGSNDVGQNFVETVIGLCRVDAAGENHCAVRDDQPLAQVTTLYIDASSVQ